MITIAINKGRIYQETVQLLLRAKILDQASTKEDRRLVFSSPSGDYRFLVVRSADVPIYVERGAADIGVTGKDSIMEYGASMTFYETMDLGLGKCRIMTAWPKESPEPFGKIKVATKFVNIAREYFDSQNRQVEMIKLSGALEIAPSLGLSDCIVDLVATGETLNANGMEPRELIAEISSRLIVNRAALKTKFDEINVFTNLITSVACKDEGD